MKIIKYLIKNIFSIIYPTTCICCYKIINKDGIFCKNCFRDLEFISPIKCQICSLPIRNQYKFCTNISCAPCLQKKPHFDSSYAIFIYNQTIGKAIIDLKYKDQTFLALKFAKIFKSQIKNIISQIDYVISVPMHKKKLVKRKYNQANLLARNISPEKYFPQVLLRIKNDDSQIGLSRNKRKKNLRKSFIVNPKFVKNIYGKKILIIDDVMTTASTLNYCARALKRNGVTKVYVAVIAKTVNNKINLNN
jgi:ComF family protein